MTFEPYALFPNEESQVWATFPNSPAQRVLHNEFLKKLREERDKLDNIKPEDLKSQQEKIILLKSLIGILHRNDKQK